MQKKGSVIITNLFNLFLEEFHFSTLPVDKHHISRLTVLDQLHDAFCIGVSRKRHVLKYAQQI